MKNWSFLQWITAIIIACGAVAILQIALPQMGVTIPIWIINILWVIVIVFIAVGAIRLLATLFSGPGPPNS